MLVLETLSSCRGEFVLHRVFLVLHGCIVDKDINAVIDLHQLFHYPHAVAVIANICCYADGVLDFLSKCMVSSASSSS
ncbi:hypothetical protein AAC387_Pa10g1233 [Persea americana]